MFELTYNLEVVGKYKNFSDAFIELYKKLKEDLKQGISYMLLENAIWIKSPFSDHPIMFYEARDIACNIGLLKDGVLNPDFKGKL